MSNEEVQPRVFEVFPENLEGLKVRLAKLSKKAVKLGLAPIAINILGEKFIEVERTNEGGERVTELTKRILLTVQGETPKLNGWSFAAVIEHQEVGNILRFLPSYAEVLGTERYRTTKAICDHCHQTRSRKDTYVVMHEDGRTAQVGRNCLKDFTGHQNPEALAAWAEILVALDDLVESFGGEGGRGERYWELSSVLSVTSCVIRRHGFTSKKAVMEAANEGRQWLPIATSTRVMGILAPPLKETKEERAERQSYVVTEEDKTEALAAQEWASEVNVDESNDYLWNLKVVAGMEAIQYRQIGLAVSMISAYQRFILNIERKAYEKTTRPVSQFVGTEKKREIFTVKLVHVQYVDGFEGRSAKLHIFEDLAGNKLTWFDSGCNSNMEAPNVYEIKATVKKHEVYREQNQTSLLRVSVVKEIPTASEEIVEIEDQILAVA